MLSGSPNISRFAYTHASAYRHGDFSMTFRFAVLLLFTMAGMAQSGESLERVEKSKKETRVKEIAVPASATSSMTASLAVRLLFAKERINPGAPDWTPAKANAANNEINGIEKELARVVDGKYTLPVG